MNKPLIIFTVVLASYLLFDKFANDEGFSEQKAQPAAKLSSKSNENSAQPEVLYEIESNDSPETELFDSEYIEATYAVELDNERIKASLIFSFYKDGTFRDFRDMTIPDSKVGETTGTYSIEGASLTLIYLEERDKNVFSFDEAKMSLHKDGTLRTGTVVLNKQ